VLAASTLVPVSASIRGAIAPASARVESALYVGTPERPAEAQPRPLTLDPSATEWAVALGAALVLLFWSARAIASRRGLRATARGIAWIGLALSALALLQHGSAPDRVYWWIRPGGRRPSPFGPFVNRNDLATWLIMAAPLVVGYAVARVQSRRRRDSGAFDIAATIDATTLWLGASVFFMVATLLVTVSRSALIGEVAGAAGFLWLARGRMRRSSIGWLTAIGGTLVAGAATYASWNTLATRMEETLALGLGGRREIWDLTWRMAADFRLAGIGVGAYERVMALYQPLPHVFYFNHAHNEYLQLMAEGGLILAVPAAVAAGAASWQIWRSVDAHRTAVFWIRAGAAGGLIAAAVQSVWNTGLRLPANAVLFALLAAMAVHDGRARAESMRQPTSDRNRMRRAGGCLNNARIR